MEVINGRCRGGSEDRVVQSLYSVMSCDGGCHHYDIQAAVIKMLSSVMECNNSFFLLYRQVDKNVLRSSISAFNISTSVMFTVVSVKASINIEVRIPRSMAVDGSTLSSLISRRFLLPTVHKPKAVVL